jgi:hypothetical protein
MAKILQPNTITSASSPRFEELYHSTHHSLLTKPSFVTSQFLSPTPDWYGPSSVNAYSSNQSIKVSPSDASQSKSVTPTRRSPSSVSIYSTTTTPTLKAPPSKLPTSYHSGTSSPPNIPRHHRPRLGRKTKKKPPHYTKPDTLTDTPLYVADSLSQMSFCNSASAVHTVSIVPAFTGPVTTPWSRPNLSQTTCSVYGTNVESTIQPLVDTPSRPPGHPYSFDGARHDTAIDILSSSDEEELETMPELIDGCNNCYNSSSDEDCMESVRPRSNPDYPPVPVTSFFAGNKADNDAELYPIFQYYSHLPH